MARNIAFSSTHIFKQIANEFITTRDPLCVYTSCTTDDSYFEGEVTYAGDALVLIGKEGRMQVVAWDSIEVLTGPGELISAGVKAGHEGKPLKEYHASEELTHITMYPGDKLIIRDDTNALTLGPAEFAFDRQTEVQVERAKVALVEGVNGVAVPSNFPEPEYVETEVKNCGNTDKHASHWLDGSQNAWCLGIREPF